MAVDITPSASYTRAGLTGVVSIGGWLRIDVLPTSGLMYNVVSGRDNGASNWGQLEVDNVSSQAQLNVWSNNTGNAVVTGPNLTLGTWYYAIYSLNGTAWTLRYRAAGQTSLTTFTGTGSSTVASNNLRFGREATVDAATTFNGALHMWRVYTSVLSAADALAESAATSPTVTVWANYPFENTTNHTSDVSGNARNLTYSAGSGSVANTTGPNISLGTNITVAALAETDSLAAVNRSVNRTAGTFGETDALVATGHATSRAVSAIAETDALAPTPPASEHAVTALVETDAMAPAAATKALAPGELSEADTLTSAAQSVDVELGGLAELDALSQLNATKAVDVTALTEVDALLPAAGSAETTITVGVLVETDAVAPLLASKELTAGLLAEIDVLSPAAKSLLVGVLSETDDLHALVSTVLGIDFTVTVGPTRIRDLASLGVTRRTFDVADTRRAADASPTRLRPPVTPAATRKRDPVSVAATRTGWDAADTRTGWDAGPTEIDRED